jgi:hypothetical protein
MGHAPRPESQMPVGRFADATPEQAPGFPVRLRGEYRNQCIARYLPLFLRRPPGLKLALAGCPALQQVFEPDKFLVAESE